MKVIRANCRVQFTAADIDFILRVLGGQLPREEALNQLLADEESRNAILDDEALFHAVLEAGGCLEISTHFYFYILVRHVFQRAGLFDRDVADYVAEVLSEYSRTERTRCVIPGRQDPIDYFFEMVAALPTADERTSFYIRTHIGNQSLFLSGVFPDRIRSRAESRGFPSLRYYEALGRTNFLVARDHRLARNYELTDIFDALSEQFQTTRRALNDLGQRLVFLGDSAPGLDAMLDRLGPSN